MEQIVNMQIYNQTHMDKKELPKAGMVSIAQIMNAILYSGHYPTELKTDSIIVTPKPGKHPSELSSYRPISLLPVLTKVFETLFLKKIEK